MRISDWSSDVCSSDLQAGEGLPHPGLRAPRHLAPPPALRSAQGVQACASQWLASSTPSPRKREKGFPTSPSQSGKTRRSTSTPHTPPAELPIATAASPRTPPPPPPHHPPHPTKKNPK